MPALQYWFTGSAMAACIAFAGGIAALGYGWYAAAISEQTSAEEKAAATAASLAQQQAAIAAAAAEQRKNLLETLRNEYILSHDGISAELMAGTALPPKAWLNKRLQELGADWRVE